MKIILSVLTLTVLLSADTLYLKDGNSVRGTFLSGTSREIRFLPENGRATRYAVDRIASVTFGPAASSTGTRARTVEGTAIPAGTTVTARMIDTINSDVTNAGESFRASLDEPLIVNGRTVVPKGADVMVKIVSVDESGRLAGREEIAIELSEIVTDRGRYVAQSSHAVVAAKSRGEENLKVIGGTAVVGAIIGAIAGGGKGAAIGAATGAGAGAAVQAIRGQRVQIPSESRLDFTLSEPLYID
jgi:hypothetical protein